MTNYKLQNFIKQNERFNVEFTTAAALDLYKKNVNLNENSQSTNTNNSSLNNEQQIQLRDYIKYNFLNDDYKNLMLSLVIPNKLKNVMVNAYIELADPAPQDPADLKDYKHMIDLGTSAIHKIIDYVFNDKDVYNDNEYKLIKFAKEKQIF